MAIDQFWRILIRRWLLIVACFLFVGVGAFVGSKLTKPLYKSSVLVQVVISSSTNSQGPYDSLLASDDLVQTESTLAVSDPVLSEVATHYPDLSEGDLSDEVSASPMASTQIFEIDVVDPSPVEAASIANDVAATLIKQQLQAIQQSNTQSQQQIQQNLNQISQQIRHDYNANYCIAGKGRKSGTNSSFADAVGRVAAELQSVGRCPGSA